MIDQQLGIEGSKLVNNWVSIPFHFPLVFGEFGVVSYMSGHNSFPSVSSFSASTPALNRNLQTSWDTLEWLQVSGLFTHEVPKTLISKEPCKCYLYIPVHWLLLEIDCHSFHSVMHWEFLIYYWQLGSK